MSGILKYNQQANEPEWFNKNEDHFYHAVTSGSSLFNEWYEFESEEDALEFALYLFKSQSVIDHFTRATAEDGRERWFHNDDVSSFDEVDGYTVKKGATPASFADLAQAESRF